MSPTFCFPLSCVWAHCNPSSSLSKFICFVSPRQLEEDEIRVLSRFFPTFPTLETKEPTMHCQESLVSKLRMPLSSTDLRSWATKQYHAVHSWTQLGQESESNPVQYSSPGKPQWTVDVKCETKWEIEPEGVNSGFHSAPDEMDPSRRGKYFVDKLESRNHFSST